ncbi:MAG: chloride channel protein [Betaproteobacteria bacterium]|nr:chloride channel protein [Betaproteobacteria bacterium]
MLPLFSPRSWRKHLLLMSAALIAATLCILFAKGADHAIEIHRKLIEGYAWVSLAIAPAGFAAMAWLSMRLFPGTEGSGIPQAIAASLSDEPGTRKQFLSLRLAISKIFLTLGGLVAGASIGREGPSVQIGASIMHILTKSRRFGHIGLSRDLIAAGAGAGIAAAFNTPLAGIMFAIEEMCRYRTFRANGATLVSVILAGLASLAILGNYNYFGRTAAGYTLGWPGGVWPALAAGVLGGFLGGGFARLLIASSRGLPGNVGRLARQRPVVFAALCGLGTAIVGLMCGGITYGTGYAETRAALEGNTQLPLYFMLAKMAVIWLAFTARIPGGILAPTLAVGAGMGAIIASILPGIPAGDQAAILVLGMGGFLAAMTQAPITAFVIVMEMTANHQMLLPLMAASVIAHGISKSVCRVPLYHALATPTLYHGELKQRSQESTPGSGNQSI